MRSRCSAYGLDGSRGSFSEQVLKLAKDLFDWVQVWRIIGRKKRLAPAKRMSWPTTLFLWLPRLTKTPTLPG